MLQNPAHYRKLKKDIARILTILRERELKEQIKK
jgi:ribosomal protein L29